MVAVGLRAAPELDQEETQTLTGTIEIGRRVERGEHGIHEHRVVEAIDETSEELGIDPIEEGLFEGDATRLV